MNLTENVYQHTVMVKLSIHDNPPAQPDCERFIIRSQVILSFSLKHTQHETVSTVSSLWLWEDEENHEESGLSEEQPPCCPPHKQTV